MRRIWSGQVFVEYSTINLLDQSALDYPDQLPEKAPDWPPGELVRSGPGWLSLNSATSDHYAVVFLVVANGPYLAVPGEVGASAGEVDFHTGLVGFSHVTMGPASEEIALPGEGGRYRSSFSAPVVTHSPKPTPRPRPTTFPPESSDGPSFSRKAKQPRLT